MAGIRISDLTAELGLIFRITHVRNLPWILENGLHCARSNRLDPNFVSIGNADLIDKRRTWPVSHEMGGTLADYVPFYFTPRSPMMKNIVTGHNGVTKRENAEIVVLVSSISHLTKMGLPFLIADRHAVYRLAQFSSDPAFLANIDWQILQRSDFRRNDDTDPDRIERYQAETLVSQHVPAHGLIGIACSDDAARTRVQSDLRNTNIALKVAVRREWYF